MRNEPLEWQTLTPGALPTAGLKVVFDAANPIRDLASFDFVGFVRRGAEPDAPLVGDEEAAAFLSPNFAASRDAGRNHYGQLYRMALDTRSLYLEDYSYGDECQATAMAILRHLIVDLGRECQWTAHTEYYDSGEYSGPEVGTHVELRALFDAHSSTSGH